VKKIALITGINGQDGSYLAKYLLGLNYEVHGAVRRKNLNKKNDGLWRIKDILNKITLHGLNLEAYSEVNSIVKKVQPDECYHLAADSFVPNSFNHELSVMNTNVSGVHNLLASLKENLLNCRFYFAGSSEVFGNTNNFPQDELTKFNPNSIYGISKVTGYYITKYYREKYNMYACSGVLYNHESPVRGEEFVTKKITVSLSRIKNNMQEVLYLGNLNAKRDWGHAKDYVYAQWLMLQQDCPSDFCIATGEQHTVRDFVKIAWGFFERSIVWTGKGLDEKGYDSETGKMIVAIDPNFFREYDVDNLVGNTRKAKELLNWTPKISFQELVYDMMSQENMDKINLTDLL
jgi:GDPmannose 4,6-dehydratase